MPALAVVTLVALFLIGPFFTPLPFAEYMRHPQTERFWGNLYFYPANNLPGVFTTNPLPSAINGSLWTLPVEVAMYVAAPLLVLAGRRRGAWLVLVLIGSLAVSTYFFVEQPPRLVVLGTEFWTAATLVLFFIAGSAVVVLGLERYFDWRLGLLAFVLVGEFGRFLGPWSDVPLCFVLPFAVFPVGLARWPVVSQAGRWGDFSYGIYLWAFPTTQTLIALLGPRLSG